jgi:hypothetical protein
MTRGREDANPATRASLCAREQARGAHVLLFPNRDVVGQFAVR